MSYLTIADLENALGSAMVLRLLDDDNDGVADTGPLASVLSDAEGLVNGYVSKQYNMATLLSDAAATAQLRMFARAIAVEFAYRRRSDFYTRDGTPHTTVYAETLKQLKDVATGTIRIDTNGAPMSPAVTHGGITGISSGGLVVTACDPTSFTNGFGSF